MGRMPYDKERVLDDRHWVSEEFKQRIPATTWKHMLLHDDDQIISAGRIRKLVAKRLGYGVVEISKAPLKQKSI